MAFENFKRVVTQVLQLTYNGGITFGDGKIQTSAYRGYAGQFSSAVTQATASGTALNVVALADTDYSDGVSVATNKITYANGGVYAFEFDAQVENINTTTRQDIYFFLRKNGVDVVGSTTSASIVVQASSIAGKTLVTSTHMISVSAGDYIELIWAGTSTDVRLQYTAASATGIVRPSTASISVATWLLK